MTKPSKSLETTAYILLGNGRVALRFLEDTDVPPYHVILNRPEKQRLGREMEDIATRRGIESSNWDGPETLISAARPGSWLLSVYFAHILSEGVLGAFEGRAVNIHPSYLPWNKGANTTVWPLLDGTPAGVTAHRMVPEVDAGEILTRREVPVRLWDTAGSLYRRLEDAAIDLLLTEWPRMLSVWPGRPQTGEGTRHIQTEFRKLVSVSKHSHGSGPCPHWAVSGGSVSLGSGGVERVDA